MKKRTIAICLMVILIAVLGAGCRRSPWNDGEFRGEGQGHKSTIKVNLTIARGKIDAIVVTEQGDTPDYVGPAVEQIPQRIIKKQSTQVDVVTGSTRSSNGIIAAVNDALAKAKK